MIKKIFKILLIVILILSVIIFYLSIFGLKTDKFNTKINNNISKIDENINLNLKKVNYLLKPYNFTVNVESKNPEIIIRGKSLKIEKIITNISLKSFINNQFAIDDLLIKVKEIKLNNVISLARVFKSSPELYLLETIVKDGFIKANIYLNFDDKGKIDKNYKIKGSIKRVKIDYLNQFNLQNLSFDFDIDNEIYLLNRISTKVNNTEIKSPLIEIKRNKDLFFVNGQILNDNKVFDIKELKSIFFNLFKNIDVEKIEFKSKNNFSFNVNKKIKIKDFKVKSFIDLNELVFKEKNSQLKLYLPSFIETIKLEKHKIIINYDKNELEIEGDGNILVEDKSDNLSYRIKKNKNNLLFDLKTNLKNNSLVIDFLDYEKKEDLKTLISVKGNLKKNNQLSIDLIDLKEKDNKISIKGLELNESFKVMDIKNFNINYINNKKILNNLNLKKDNKIYFITGESFDISRIIDNIIDSDEENSSFFHNLNSKINIRIKKTYIDELNYINNLYGDIKYKNNIINDLKLESTFSNEKKINLSIETKNNSESVTRLFSAYPKPLVKRYDFIKGFEEGSLNFYSIKKDGVSNSVLVIDNFKVKEVPIFAKLLSLASLQGMADLLTGEGIRFTDFEMNFSNKKDLTTINEMYAIGPAVSILMDGYIEAKKLVSLRGTLVPATTINRSIASIPLLGKILIGDKTGEGIFGVSFKIKGPPKNLKTSVNPIKTLTPRFITRTLEKIKKN